MKKGIKGHAERWEEMFKRLVHFKKNYGHCDVPNKYKDDRKLGYWVASQRRKYKALGMGHKLTPSVDEKFKRLLELGFNFSPKDFDSVQWEHRFNEYVVFVHKYGQTEVPETAQDNSGLSLWVSKQREAYILRTQGFQTHLTDDQVDLLNKVGFEWEHKPKTSDPRSCAANTTYKSSPTASFAEEKNPLEEQIVSIAKQCIYNLNAQEKAKALKQAQQQAEHRHIQEQIQLVFSITEKCIYDLDAQEKAKALQQAQQRQIQEQMKKQELALSIMNNLFGNEVPVATIMDMASTPALQHKVPSQHQAIGQKVNFNTNSKPLDLIMQFQASNLKKGSKETQQQGAILSKIEQKVIFPSTLTYESNNAPKISATYNMNTTSTKNFTETNRSTNKAVATLSFPVDSSLTCCNNESRTGHDEKIASPYVPSRNILPSLSTDDGGLTQSALNLRQIYSDFLQIGLKSS